MSAQAPLVSVTESSLVETSFEQPKLPATTSVIMRPLKPIDINLFLPKFLYTDSPNRCSRICRCESIVLQQVSTNEWMSMANDSIQSIENPRVSTDFNMSSFAGGFSRRPYCILSMFARSMLDLPRFTVRFLRSNLNPRHIGASS